MKTSFAILAVLAVSACTNTVSSEPTRLIEGVHRGSNSGTAPMMEWTPKNILRGLVLAADDTEFRCDQDRNVNPDFAFCVGKHGDVYSLSNCTPRKSCDVFFNQEPIGVIDSYYYGDTWSAFATWYDQEIQIVRDGNGAWIEVK